MELSWRLAGVVALIYIGSCFYVYSAFNHVKLGKAWTIWKAMSIALPLVFVEYMFSLHGNYYAYNLLKLTATQVLFITISFYFVNTTLLNIFVLKRPTIWWRDAVSLGLLFFVIFLSTLSPSSSSSSSGNA
jgi:hypothetical protein